MNKIVLTECSALLPGNVVLLIDYSIGLIIGVEHVDDCVHLTHVWRGSVFTRERDPYEPWEVITYNSKS